MPNPASAQSGPSHPMQQFPAASQLLTVILNCGLQHHVLLASEPPPQPPEEAAAGAVAPPLLALPAAGLRPPLPCGLRVVRIRIGIRTEHGRQEGGVAGQ